jgi:hypothetical protein
VVAYRARDRAVFLFGFAKSDQENIDQDDLLTTREVAADWLAVDDESLAQAIAAGELKELSHDHEEA